MRWESRSSARAPAYAEPAPGVSSKEDSRGRIVTLSYASGRVDAGPPSAQAESE